MRIPHRRTFLHLAAGAATLPAVARIARAQAYPSRPVRIVVGFAAAGGNDIVARIMGQWLSEKLGQQFIIENRPGAGTNIATEARELTGRSTFGSMGSRPWDGAPNQNLASIASCPICPLPCGGGNS